MLRAVHNMRSIRDFISVAFALLWGIASASVSVPTVMRSEGGVVRALVSHTNANYAQGESQTDTDSEALDWAAAIGQRSDVIKANAEAQKLQRQTTAKLSIDQLLQFLDDVDRVEKPLSETEFIPRCLAQVQKVIKMINVTFGQENLQQVVTEECLQNKDFPLPSADGFNKMQACRSLVEDLTKLSNQEWKTGSRKGYFNFCASYVRNKDEDGLPAPYSLVSNSAPKEKAGSALSVNADTGSDATPSGPFIALTMLAALCIVGAAFFTLRQNS